MYRLVFIFLLFLTACKDEENCMIQYKEQFGVMAKLVESDGVYYYYLRPNRSHHTFKVVGENNEIITHYEELFHDDIIKMNNVKLKSLFENYKSVFINDQDNLYKVKIVHVEFETAL